MYSICITGSDKHKKVHEVFSTPFERSEFSNNIIAKMLDDLTAAPFRCIPDMMHIKNDETGADSCFWFCYVGCVALSRVATVWLEYFMMAPEEQVKRHSDYAQLIASLISGHMK